MPSSSTVKRTMAAWLASSGNLSSSSWPWVLSNPAGRVSRGLGERSACPSPPMTTNPSRRPTTATTQERRPVITSMMRDTGSLSRVWMFQAT